MSQKKVKSLSKKLTARVIIIALAILLVAVISSQVSSSASFWKATEESIAKSTSIAMRDVNTLFTEAEALLESTANGIIYVDYTNQQTARNYLYSARSPFPFVSEIYIGITDTNQYSDGAGYIPPPEWVLTQRPYYIGAMNTDGIFYQDPYLSSTGVIYSSIAVKLKDQRGAAIGVVVVDLALDTLLNLCNNAAIQGTTASGFLLDSNSRILAHKNSAFMPSVQGGETVYMNYDSIVVLEKETITDGRGDGPRLTKAVDYDGVEKYICTAVLPGSGWTFGFAVPVNDFAGQLNTTSSLLMYALIIAVAITGIFFASQLLLIRPLKPIGHIVETAKMLAVGKTPNPLNIQTDDELGVLADDFNKFIASTQEQVTVLSKVAEGNLTTDVTPKSQDDLLSHAINRMTGNTRSLISDINNSALQISIGAKQVADGASSLAQGSTEQAASIQELSASISQIAERTKTNAQTADKTSKLSATIKGSAEKGSHQMDDMINAVGEINEASKNISKIIKTIDDIAFQTNILALNAAVEAARAGQHGKGFAVVAEEVRNLASKSAEAAKDTGNMIQNSMDKAEFGSRIAEETAASLNEIVTGINETSRLISDIAKASEEQAEGISQINIGIDQVAQVIQQNSATAQESAAASGEMNDQSGILEQLISQFTLDADDNARTGLPSHSQERAALPRQQSSRNRLRKHLALPGKSY